MTVTTIANARPAANWDLVPRGRWCIATALIGIAQGAAVLAWPHQVASSRFSFPFTPGWYVVAQVTFFLQHLPLVLAVAAVASVPVVRHEKLAYRALLIATAGLALLALLELATISAATTAENSSLGTTIGTLYSVPVLMTGAGLLVAGVVLLRRHTLGRHLPLILVALGAFVFVALTPAIATNSFVAGRLAIIAWMTLFALLGWLMQRQPR